MNIKTEFGFAKILLGIITGAAITFAFTGISPITNPKFQQPEGLLQLAEFDMFNTQNSPETRIRAMAVILAQKPELFAKLDESISDEFLLEFIEKYDLHKPSLSFEITEMNLLQNSGTSWGEQVGLLPIPNRQRRALNQKAQQLLAQGYLQPIRRKKAGLVFASRLTE